MATDIQNITERLNAVSQEIAQLEDQIRGIPMGTIYARKNRHGTYSYFKNIELPDGSKKEVYIKKAEVAGQTDIAYRMYAEKKLQDLQFERKYLQTQLEYQAYHSKADQFLEKHPGLNQLMQLPQTSRSGSQDPWKYAPYKRNMKYPEAIKYPTVVPDLKVRSKSEADIVSCLEKFQVPYHYDELFNLSGYEIAMDFVCRNVRSNVIYYWDHRGMSDDQKYQQKILFCDKLFLDNHIIPWVNLIVTSETLEHPLDIPWVETIIQHYLL